MAVGLVMLGSLADYYYEDSVWNSADVGYYLPFVAASFVAVEV